MIRKSRNNKIPPVPEQSRDQLDFDEMMSEAKDEIQERDAEEDRDELENALNIAGATFTFTDKGEGTIPFEFQGHQSNALQQEYAPCTLVFFDPAA